MGFETEQEKFWAGEFGDDYIERNNSEQLLAANFHFFSGILSHTRNVASCLELGANIGMNLRALTRLLPQTEFTAVEINSKACEQLKKIQRVKAINGSIFEVQFDSKFDLVFTKGVMIHLNPEYLPMVYRKMYESSNRYICVAEYFNPAPAMIEYRGHAERLYKRDFAGEMMDMFSDLKLVAYQFCYNRDPNFPQDDITWFLLEKTK